MSANDHKNTSSTELELQINFSEQLGSQIKNQKTRINYTVPCTEEESDPPRTYLIQLVCDEVDLKLVLYVFKGCFHILSITNPSSLHCLYPGYPACETGMVSTATSQKDGDDQIN